MLELRRLEIQGFGPFADEQTIEFPAEPGITLVYGENMRGKTSLLNAVRYAFYGTVLGRGSRRRRLHSISNRDLAAEGKYGFSVSLGFVSDGQEYELVRECVPLRDTPTDDEHYRQDLLLRQGSRVLGPQERDVVLARVLPAQVSRFFLFDGELLQEYEELLHDESEAGRTISESIERILGVPILKRGRAHLMTLADEASTEAAREASRSKQTQAIGTALEQAGERKEAHKKEIARLQGELADLQSRKSEAEAFLKSERKYLSILEERDGKEARLGEVETEIEQIGLSLQEAMREAWRSVLAGPVRRALEEASKEAKQEVDRLAVRLKREALRAMHCGTCDRDLDSQAAAHLKSTIPEETGSEQTVAPAVARLVDLNKFQPNDMTGLVRELTERLGRLEVESIALKDRLRDLQTELGDADIDRLRGDSHSLSDTIKKITVTEDAIEKEEEAIKKIDANIKKLTDELARMAPENLRASQVKSSVLRAASEVFDAAVDRYKRDLRGKVESTASDLFLRMTTEGSDYERLEITESYGLNIIHKDSRIEEGRSAGAEHVVALALIGALQANAPLRGPIVMDSPFGRLDEGHTKNVVAALPTMAPQVVLLVHEAELRRNNVREILGSRLLREYELVKVSARRTRIEPVR